MITHILAMIVGFVLDLIIGDPYCLPHPIRLIGNWINFLVKRLQLENRDAKKEQRRGVYLVVFVLGATLLLCTLLLVGAYWIHPVCGFVVESIMTYQILATKCLKVESMKVYLELERGDIKGARTAVSMIVGRDTDSLDEVGIAKAAIETVAENTSDGVLAPMIYTAIGGPILGFLYKAVNTMDSMVGYKNEKYLYFGRAAAKLDDFVNYVPARISALFLIAASAIASIGKGVNVFRAKSAWKIYKRDRYNHASPNSAQTESTCAGALGIQLAGDACYFGKVVKKPYIGDATRSVEIEDIKRVNRLMYIAAFLCEVCCLLILGGIYLCLR